MLLNLIIISISYGLLLLWCLTGYISYQSYSGLDIFLNRAMNIAYFLQLFLTCWISLDLKPGIPFHTKYGYSLLYFAIPMPVVTFIFLFNEQSFANFITTEFLSFIVLTLIVFVAHALVITPLSTSSKALSMNLARLLLIAFSWTYYIR